VSSLFDAAGLDMWLPNDLARGPWDPDALHGGPTAALLARAVEPLLAPLQPTRLTVELLRRVPVAPLHVTARLTRDGRKIRIAEARMEHDGTAVGTAGALGIRTKRLTVVEQPTERPAGPEVGSEPDRSLDPYEAFHNKGVQHSFVRGVFGEPGPATDWIRLRLPLVPDEQPSPFQRVAAAADFGNGISGLDVMNDLLFINPDLTIHLSRLPVGEWICLDARSRYEPEGIGISVSDLYDEAGPVGRSIQSLLLDSR
jgi:Acyl-CoA thioesterase C-terminal domain/Acyl-CoA thioesterase N-terminal domain